MSPKIKNAPRRSPKCDKKTRDPEIDKKRMGALQSSENHHHHHRHHGDDKGKSSESLRAQKKNALRSKDDEHQLTVSEQRRDIMKQKAPFLDRFEQKDYNVISEILKQTFTDTDHLTKDDFKQLCSLLVEKGFFKDMQCVPFDDQLFQYFDLNHDGELNKRELMGGLALITRGTAEEKLRLTFDLFDADGNGKLDRAELFRCVKAAYLQAINMMTREEQFQTEEETKQFRKKAIAHCRNQVDEIFVECDSNADYQMDFTEFKRWGLSSPIIRLGDLEGQNFDVRLTLHVKSQIQTLPEYVFLDLLDAKVDSSAMHAKIFGYCCVVSLIRSDLTLIPIKGGETEVIHSNNPEYHHTFQIHTEEIAPPKTLGIQVELRSKMDEQGGVETSIGIVSLDWGYLEKKYGALVEYSLMPNDESRLRKTSHCHGIMRIRVRSTNVPESLPCLKSSFEDVMSDIK